MNFASGSREASQRALRPVADQHRTDAGHPRQVGEGADAVPAVQAADVPDDDERSGAGPGARPVGVQPGVAQLRSERRGVDAGRPDAGLDVDVGEPVAHPAGGHEDQVGAPGHLGPPPLGGQVGDGGLLHGERGHAQPAGVLEGLAAHGVRGGDVHQVGSERLERRPHLGPDQLARLDPGDPAAAVGREPGRLGDDDDVVAGVDEPVEHRLDRGRGAVDRREERLGNESDPHGDRVRWRGRPDHGCDMTGG